MYFFYNPMFYVYVAPALLLAMWAQMRVKTTYAAAQQMPAPLSGAAAARHILDSAGLSGVAIEQVPGKLSDHYDPREKVLRLSSEVYGSRSLAAVGIAAHEAGHAIQDARHYAPLVVRNIAVPAASFGTNTAFILFFLGMIFESLSGLALVGLILFGCVAFFQIVNLPVEFNASTRAKTELVSLGIITDEQITHVNRVLSAAAWTYVAATLMAILQLLYFIMRYAGNRR